MILPGQTLGILGGGQLGRMFAIAARRMGYRVAAIDPTTDCPTGQVADVEVTAAYDDLEAAERFARQVDVVTFEFENVPAETLAAVERIVPVRPSPFVLETTRHRLREKDWLRSHGFPVADYRRVDGPSDLEWGLAEYGEAILKSAEFGYDGKGQHWLDADRPLPGDAFDLVVAATHVLERVVPFDREASVVVARSLAGDVACYEPFENAHRNGILDVTVCPADLSPRLAAEARALAVKIAEAIGLVGVLCVELFVVGDQLIVNELAPRPHNSGHLTIDACATDQFEQQVRAVCGLRLGDVTLRRPAAMANLLGDLWQGGDPRWAEALAVDPRVKLHLYGKSEAKPGRKMGHLTATADTAAEARRLVLDARDRLTDPL